VAIQRNFRVALALVFVPFPDAFLLNPRLNHSLITIDIDIANAGGADAVCLGGR